jgi:hypothetical protein
MSESPRSFFGESPLVLVLTLLLLFGLGFAIRVYDIDDLPLDFHPTRQLFSAIKARGMYYQDLPDVPEWQRRLAVQMWKTKVTIEPEILPRLAAFLYQFTGEKLWVPRLLSSIFWLVGGIFVYLLGCELVSTDGAIVSLAFYLFTPYGIFASRTFQPDPLMVMSILVFWWLVWKWVGQPSWKWAILAGLLGGLAIFIKLVAAFFVVGGAFGALLGRLRVRNMILNAQLWVMAILGLLPGAIWAFDGLYVANFLKNEFAGNFIPSLLGSPVFYLQWQNNATFVAGSVGISLGLLGFFLVKGRNSRLLFAGIWTAYLVFGLYFNYHISTHDYYSLPLIPIVAISLAPFGAWFFERLARTTKNIWMRIVVYIVLLYGVGASLWTVRNEMKSIDYRPEEAYWAEISSILGHQASVIALTSDYGSSLEYWGWQNSALWPPSGQLYYQDVRGGILDIDKLFKERVSKKALFLIADLDDFERQTYLKHRLYSAYPIYAEGDGFLVFDLANPLENQP